MVRQEPSQPTEGMNVWEGTQEGPSIVLWKVTARKGRRAFRFAKLISALQANWDKKSKS